MVVFKPFAVSMTYIPDLHYLSIVEAASLIARREISSVEFTQALLNRIASVDSGLHSYARLMPHSALTEAESADREIALGRRRGPLHGVPIAIKDLCWTKDAPTSAGMAIHRQFQPREDATVVRRLREAGAVILGKLQLTEGAYSDYHPTIQAPQNPWDATYWPGISSSGSAVATAAGLCFGSLASDTGGSIRWPCAANGVTGIKPTWGRVSRYGVFELAASLDHVGTIARSAVDAGLLLQMIAGSDPADPTTLAGAVPDYLAAAAQGVEELRIGVDTTWNGEDVDDRIRSVLAAAVETFISLGAEIVPVSFPDPSQVIADWVLNCAVEAAVAHEQTYAEHRREYGPVLASVIEHGRAISAMEYQKVLLRRMAFRGRVNALFNGIDLLLTPVQPFEPLTLATIRTLGEQPHLITKLQRFTCPFDMSGHPTITLPAGASDSGMPMGIQLVAAALGEDMLVRAGAAFQRTTHWHRRRPVA
jgi:amidase